MNKETDLIDGLRSGDEKAYRYLYDYHYSTLCGVAYGLVKDYEAAEMIVSDVIYAVWKNRERLEINQTLRSYLLKCVRNGSLLYLNRQARQVNIYGIEEQLRDIDTDKMDAHPLSKLIEAELDIKITKCIENMPSLTRKIFVLNRFSDFKYDEIAVELNVSVDVVKYHIKSALSKLRKALKDYLILLMLFLLSQ